MRIRSAPRCALRTYLRGLIPPRLPTEASTRVCREPRDCLYFTLAALGLAGPLSFMARSTAIVSPFFTSASEDGGTCTMIVPSDVFTWTQPVFVLTLVTLPSMVWRPVIWSDCAAATPTLATMRAAASDSARRLFIARSPVLGWTARRRVEPRGDDRSVRRAHCATHDRSTQRLRPSGG